MNPTLFILLEAAKPPAEENIKIGEILAPILSGLAFTLSAAAFIFTVIIQLKERKRNLRQTLSTSLSDIARINVDVSKLKNEVEDGDAGVIKMLKSYNAQRGTLASNADFLIKENEKLITDSDCQLMAFTYDDLGDTRKAKEYWQQAIDRSDTPAQKHLHQRDYAAFLYSNNEEKEGRDLFEASLNGRLNETDNELRYLSETYLIWAKLERNFDDQGEFDRLMDRAKEQCHKIKHKGKQKEMGRLIEQTINPPIKKEKQGSEKE
ncbi:hypothetical protein [Mucilaginibacter myungsuensis]|uniref:Tetratricopeptide repeat protein n=1 Tax=Mucilaginibacter myungsuensis TaxID=649104 RepID=A0A929KZW7_9SPHI|nr:hypothetical protein [Mucilaginibacter myungsuensis]MBE9663692.1 hypothetical protein [Mucilaginibacter myungsuensis]MDN3598984.1 hypothetical protein [Mucilaginibacter myungsuensis]